MSLKGGAFSSQEGNISGSQNWSFYPAEHNLDMQGNEITDVSSVKYNNFAITQDGSELNIDVYDGGGALIGSALSVDGNTGVTTIPKFRSDTVYNSYSGDQSLTYSASDIATVSQTLRWSGLAGTVCNVAFPTGTQLDTAVGASATVGMRLPPFYIFNGTAPLNYSLVSLSFGSGITAIGNKIVGPALSALVSFTRTGTNAWIASVTQNDGPIYSASYAVNSGVTNTVITLNGITATAIVFCVITGSSIGSGNFISRVVPTANTVTVYYNSPTSSSSTLSLSVFRLNS